MNPKFLIKYIVSVALLFTAVGYTNARAQLQEIDNAADDVIEDSSKEENVESDLAYFTREEWGADDELLTNLSADLAEPENIIIVDLAPVTRVKTSQDFIQDLYYFFTFKMGLGDLPFHYLIDTDGNVYEGNVNGVDSILVVDGYDRGDVIVGYIDNPNEEHITQDSIDKNFVSAVQKVLDFSFIKPSNISTKKLSLDLDFENKESILSFEKKDGGLFDEYVSKMRPSISKDYAQVENNSSVELVNVVLPSDFVPDTRAEIALELRNSGDRTLYYDGNSEVYVSTDKDLGHESPLFINQIWDTKSLIPIMNETDSVLKPGESKNFKFEAYVPLQSGDVTEDFALVDKFGSKFEDTEFELKMKLDLSNLKVLEIKETETGFLRVRSEGAYNSEEKTQVVPGQRFVYEERNDLGWFKIKLAENNYGWVSSQYVKIVQ